MATYGSSLCTDAGLAAAAILLFHAVYAMLWMGRLVDGKADPSLMETNKVVVFRIARGGG